MGTDDVRQVAESVDFFGDWQDRRGGGACMDAIAGHLAWATSLLQARGSRTTIRDLHSAVGFMANVAGWGAFDAGQHARARGYFNDALACAEIAGDWGLRANVLSDMARQAIYIGTVEDALTLIELAQVRQDRLTPTAQAMLSVVRARTLAAKGQGDDAYGAVLRSEDHFSDSEPDNDPTWIRYFSQAELDGDNGHALLDVALTGNHVSATRDRLARSLAAYDHNNVRARAFVLGKLSILELTRGDVKQGIDYGRQAINTDDRLSSRRARDDLARIQRALVKHRDLPDAKELQGRLARSLRNSA
ncbi:hypothetical protein [Saccharopolyspora phatthalungensis]|uniref:Transcriptional regulator n=1 Tax=Saccharopolyspora phatthalungensis TaxID=664693 RepID=A0A840QBP2_9PSEU|nr:hypothetical protein [Saccharopolyspora phatthalungensis]MBB5159962.1 hypothetical protein [Saccharopolyspora phatthalungensis]